MVNVQAWFTYQWGAKRGVALIWARWKMEKTLPVTDNVLEME